MNKVKVYLPRCWTEGSRHERLYSIWRAVAKYMACEIEVVHFENPGCVWDHATCLRMIWLKEVRLSGRFFVITEYDFLPDFSRFLPLEQLHAADRPVIAAEYMDGVGGPAPRAMGVPGAWYLIIDKKRLEKPDFSPGGPFHDPAAGLKCLLLPARPGWPEFPGARYSTGVHLFWQRHLHDPPDMIVGKERMRLGDMQRKHDAFVERWIKESPRGFQEIYNAEMERQDG